MSRSVWHKLRESKLVSLEGLQWPEVLQGLQPARKPVPGGMSWVGQRQPSPESKFNKTSPPSAGQLSSSLEPAKYVNSAPLEPLPESEPSKPQSEKSCD